MLSLSLGTFVFTFVSQHTVHLVFGSLKPELRTVSDWKVVSSLALLCSTTVSLLVGVFVYMTFWQATESDIFEIYPGIWMIDVAKLLLCVTMVLTFPLPFFTCRELLIVILIQPLSRTPVTEEESDDLLAPLIAHDEELEQQPDVSEPSGASDSPGTIMDVVSPKNWLLPEDDRQLRLAVHVPFTFSLWFLCTSLAIAAPSLGDILNLVGCFSGTLIAFILPAILSFRLEGYTHLALLILTVGGSVGVVGTFFSIKKLFEDLS